MTHYQIIGSQGQEEWSERQSEQQLDEGVEHMADPLPL